MMFGLFQVTAVKTLLVGIPESVGLLAFGLGLTAAAVFGRWLMERGETGAKGEKELEEKLTR